MAPVLISGVRCPTLDRCQSYRAFTESSFGCFPSHPNAITRRTSTPIIKSLLESLQFRRSRSWLVRSHSANNDWLRHGQSYTSKSCSPTGIFSIRDGDLRESHLCSSLLTFMSHPSIASSHSNKSVPLRYACISMTAYLALSISNLF